MTFSNPYVIGALVLVGLSVLAYWWFFVTTPSEEEEFSFADEHVGDSEPIGGGPGQPPEPVDDHTGSIGEVQLRLPGGMPQRKRFERAGVTTIDELHDLDTLEDVYGIGPSRASDIYRWFKESSLHNDLPEHLIPEQEKEDPSFDTEEEPVEDPPTEEDPSFGGSAHFRY